ncbi:Ubiquitin protein 3 [Danaus plexippus plexippus]|uniref:Ubiquitin protein 3 n=1 Tax=Danaus plexippus plexippus TaxID=278856 RepID=A0A212EPQ1_DANPL|nr:Ubiquitin protein 3 [Danaus plexippus plexippus]
MPQNETVQRYDWLLENTAPLPLSAAPCGATDNASDYGSEDSRFESWQGLSGKTKEFVFSPVDSAGDIAVHVYDNWPEADWASECVSRAEILRLIYQGRFLHSSVTLGALGLPLGRTTVMHLVPREHLPEPNSHDQRQKSKGGSSSCCSASCCIL